MLLILLPFLFGFTRHVQKNMLTAQIENRKAVGRASGHVPETLHNIRTIHCLGKENYMEKRYDQYIGESYRAMERTNFYDAVYSPVILILNAVVVAVVMLLSASGNSQILRSFGCLPEQRWRLSITFPRYSSVESLGMEIQTIQSAMAGIHRINEFFKQEEKKETYQAVRIPETDIPVEFKDVTFGYDENVVLDHVKFQVREGEQVTLAGRTGAGKSTILKLLLGLYEPQDGEVLVRGIPAAQIQAQDRRTIFGYVEQSFHMVPGTVKDQITLYDEGITDEQVREVIGLVGLKEAVEGLENGVDTWCTAELFSQGQWQLLSVARAAVAGPAILLLDEITANLDAETEQNVLMALKKVSKDRTVISISHRMTASMGRTIFIS
ncbi:MAG: ATP-binding cassette domain-containing protein [Coprococcus comes]